MSDPVPTAAPAVHDRDAALDGVRGLAVIMVLSIHCFMPVIVGPLTGLFAHVYTSMFIAVDLFFVLSGFLITSILVRARDRAGYFRTFYWRRALRILPLYSLVLLYIFGLYPLFLAPDAAAELRSHFLKFVLYYQNFSGTLASRVHWPGFYHLWSLAIEEQFYSVWPVVILLVPRPRLIPMCAGIVLFGLACRFGFYFAGAQWNLLYAITPCRVDGLAAGAFIACWLNLQPQRPLPRALHVTGAVASVALAVLVVMPHDGMKLFSAGLVVLHNTAATFAFAWLIYLLVTARDDGRLRRFFSVRVLRFLGTYSYGIYLIHWLMFVELREPLQHALTPMMGENPAVIATGVIVLSLAIPLAVLVYHLVEAPALSLKDRVPGGVRRAKAVADAPSATR